MLKAYWLAIPLLVSPASQIQNRTCDHATPPVGMHYVCSPTNLCDCRLEKDAPENEETSGSQDRDPSPARCPEADLNFFLAPSYPSAARQARKQGTVTARLLVGVSGGAEVTIESGDPLFADAVTSALNKWRFAATAQSKTLHATFTFVLAGDPSRQGNSTVSGSSPLNLVISAAPPR